MTRAASFVAAVLSCCLSSTPAGAEITVFFDSSQIATPVASGVTSDTISSSGYLFTYTRDKLFTGGTGQPIGRSVRVPWPTGVEAQAVTTPPPGVTDYKARLTVQRVDGSVFDLRAFTAQLLANTGGAGGSIEIMPVLNGQEAFNDPLYFDATGFYGQTFSYDTSPNPWGSTALLTGFDTYKIGLYVDFAMVALTFQSAAPPANEACCLPNYSCAEATPDACLGQGGTPQGVGTSCASFPCPVPVGIPTISAWGVVAMTLLLLAAGSAVLRSRFGVVSGSTNNR